MATRSHTDFRLMLVDVEKGLCEEWEEAFEGVSEVSIHHGIFQDIQEFDCMVSPANSFGLMDGGIDLAIRDFFGMQLQTNIQKVINKDFYGEQPVGTSLIIFTEHENHPFLAHTPTMRVPSDISKTDNVYNAMFAMLRTVSNHNKHEKTRIDTVLCPGLGTATGRVSYKEAARQMSLAYHHFKNPTPDMKWDSLMSRSHEIIKGIASE